MSKKVLKMGINAVLPSGENYISGITIIWGLTSY